MSTRNVRRVAKRPAGAPGPGQAQLYERSLSDAVSAGIVDGVLKPEPDRSDQGAREPEAVKDVQVAPSPKPKWPRVVVVDGVGREFRNQREVDEFAFRKSLGLA